MTRDATTQHNRRRQKAAAEAMADSQLNQMVDTTATTDENVSRKKRLLEGPEEFRKKVSS